MLPWLLLHFMIGLVGTWMARKYAIHRELSGGGMSRVFAALEIERERRLTQRHSEEIPVLSGGRLKAGMTFAQVEALTGKPLAMPPIQAAGTVVWVFADKTLTFKNERLAEMRLEKSP